MPERKQKKTIFFILQYIARTHRDRRRRKKKTEISTGTRRRHRYKIKVNFFSFSPGIEDIKRRIIKRKPNDTRHDEILLTVGGRRDDTETSTRDARAAPGKRCRRYDRTPGDNKTDRFSRGDNKTDRFSRGAPLSTDVYYGFRESARASHSAAQDDDNGHDENR